MNEGVRRLAIVLGCAGAVAHLVVIMVFVQDFEQSFEIYARIAINTALCFLIPFGLVYGTAWIIQGFKRPVGSNNKTPSEQMAERSGTPRSGSDDD